MHANNAHRADFDVLYTTQKLELVGSRTWKLVPVREKISLLKYISGCFGEGHFRLHSDPGLLCCNHCNTNVSDLSLGLYNRKNLHLNAARCMLLQLLHRRKHNVLAEFGENLMIIMIVKTVIHCDLL